MKKFAAILMLLSCCIPLLFLLLYKVREAYIHHIMEEKLESLALQSITVPEKKVHWIEEGKEILLDERMFDIKTCKKQGDLFVFTGLFDDDETILMQQLEEKQNNDAPADNKRVVRLFQWLQSVYKEINEKNSSIAGVIGRKTRFDYITSLSSHFISILTPPPQV